MKLKTNREHVVIRVIAILLSFAIGLAAVERCMRRFLDQQQGQMEQTLQDVGEQNTARLQAVMDARYMLLESMCVQMSDESDPTYLIDQFRVLLDVYNVKHIGFAWPDGRAYTTSGGYADVSGWDSFRRASAGETCLSDVCRDDLSGDGENINIYSAPVYRIGTDQLMGVMFNTYRTETFSRILHAGSFGERGTSSIFQKNGTIVAATAGGALRPGDDLYETLLRSNLANREGVGQLRAFVTAGARKEQILTLSNDGEECFFYVVEAPGRPGWYLTTIVPTAVFDQRTQPVLRNIRRMVAIIIGLLVLCALVYIWTYRRQRKELFRLAYVDPITGGDNYPAFLRKTHRGDGVSGPGYMVSVDLRDFDSINDACGLDTGNQVIRTMGLLIADRLEKGELSARISGDRFILFLHSPSLDDLIARLTVLRDRIVDISPRMNTPQLMPKFGIRAVTAPDYPERAYSDINLALRRLYDRLDLFYVVFDDSDRQVAGEIRELEGQFTQALRERQFEMWYQPKCSAQTGKPVAAEALVRWRRADGTLVPPGKFIPLFERNGMISRLDEYTFASVCAQQRAWLDQGKTILPVSVNLSRASLMFPEVTDRLWDILQGFQLTTDWVELEVTESAMEGKGNIAEPILRLREKGFHIQVDDFGSGYSSLSTLTMDCFDNVKLDKSLVDCIGKEEGDDLIRAILHLVHQFHMTATAEGVERADQADFLRDLGCDNIQGYYYYRPLPADDFAGLLD